MSDTILKNHFTKTTKEYNSAQIQELNDVKQFLKIQRLKYIKHKILYDSAQECVDNSSLLNNDLKEKVQGILLQQSCLQVVPLENENFFGSQGSSSLLGVSEKLDSPGLGYKEGEHLKKAHKVMLQEKYERLCEEFSKFMLQDINEVTVLSDDILDLDLSIEDYVLLDFKRKVNNQQKQYLQNLLKKEQILNKIAKLRIEHLPEMCNEKVRECKIKTEMYDLRMKIVQEKTRVDVFCETKQSLHAYEELIKDIKEQQEECKSDIEHLKKLKEKYNQVSSKQFNDLLQSYKQYKTSLEKKKLIYESLRK